MSNPQLFIDPECRLSKVPYKVPNNTHYVRYEDYLEAKEQPDALTAYLYAAELAKDDIKKLKAERIHDLNQIGGLQEENARLQEDVKALRVELADAQESNHILNETIAMMRKEGKKS
jgi:hypothetical protein